MLRIGHGYDVHRLTEGRKLILGGVDIPYEKGLLGHSDADVLVHAVMDSILGALALGDIGKLFPDNDSAYENADSILLLEQVIKIANSKGFTVGNIDSTIICQAPKLAGYIDKMRENIALACKTDIGNISVKATTEERLGFTGSGDGIAAHAVCIMEKTK
ncbi:MAG: 2-C-methyl-D-erythritol 2,4-cyclodiphosphate synthase [Oscillospiraceae bacterium]